MSKTSLTCPVCQTNNPRRLWTLDVNMLESDYQRYMNIEIDRMKRAHSQIALHECSECKLRFFYPSDIVGDSKFYEELQKNDWYYMPEKWEFVETLKYLPRYEYGSLLEVGSGRGDFLRMVRKHNKKLALTGLELNKMAVSESKKRNIRIKEESTSSHLKDHAAKYDFVVSFQVLEHVSNPRQVLEEMIGMLKVGGRLIVAVPDNSRRANPSIFLSESNILNMPPHHQTQWNYQSLSYLTRLFPIRLDDVFVEPATASHHSSGYRALIKKDLLSRFGKFVGWCLYIIGRPFYNHALSELNKYLPAHTILAMYTKINE